MTQDGYILMGLLVAGLFALLIYWRLRLWFVERLYRSWVQDNRTIHWGPEGVDWYGWQGGTIDFSAPYYGALGVVDDELIFKAWIMRRTNLTLPTDAILGIGLSTTRIRRGKRKVDIELIEIHCEIEGRWRVYTFAIKQPYTLMSALQNPVDWTIPYRQTDTPITAVHATLLGQDVYGAWHETGTGNIYLAPDRIVVNRKSRILFEQIRAATLYERGGLHGLNPFGQDLVRIEYDADGTSGVMGMLLRGAEQWVDLLRQQGVPVETQTGRKKKEST